MSTRQLEEEVATNTFRDILRIWIEPEIDRRDKEGRLSKDFALKRAQVLLKQTRQVLKLDLMKKSKRR
jgi:DNA-binding transcriptional regulator LsrR (DeoR family)